MTKVFTTSKGFGTKAEKIRRSVRLWENLDGYHPIEQDSVWKDIDGNYQPYILIFERVLVPFGSDSGIKTVNRVVMDAEFSKMNRIRANVVSRRKWRALEENIKYLIPLGLFATVIVIALFGG
jgi:hypothetical protein